MTDLAIKLGVSRITAQRLVQEMIDGNLLSIDGNNKLWVTDVGDAFYLK